MKNFTAVTCQLQSPKTTTTSPTLDVKHIDVDSQTQRAAFFIVKVILVILNILQILFTTWFLTMTVSAVNQQEEVEIDLKKKDMLNLNGTVLILSGIMAGILCCVGLIGALTESYGCIVAYTTVLALLFLASIASWQPFDNSRILNILIILIMTVVAATFALMLRAKERQEMDMNNNRGEAGAGFVAPRVVVASPFYS